MKQNSIWNQLKQYTSKNRCQYDQDEELRKELALIEKTVYEEEMNKDPSLKQIPRFFFQKPEENKMQDLLIKEAKRLFIEDKTKKILSSKDLDDLWEHLLNNVTPPIVTNDERINYEGFKAVATKLDPEHAAEYCSCNIFLKFNKDDQGRISIPNYFNYVLRKVSLIQNRITLTKYDSNADNYLTEKELEQYILDSIPRIPSLRNNIPKNFQRFYIVTAARKFCFFLEVNRRDRISIDDIVSSPILIEFNELFNDDLPDQDLNENWFSLPNTQSIHGLFQQLNLTMSGTLSRNELRGFNNSSLSMVFIDRMLQEYGSKKGQLVCNIDEFCVGHISLLTLEWKDYKTFVNFIIAYDNKNMERSIQFFWPILDIDKKGYLTPFTINFFFREVMKKLEKTNGEVVKIKDVNEEIYAMVKPVDPLHITLQDLITCKCGGTVIGILIDVEQFWAYDNRESLAQHNGPS